MGPVTIARTDDGELVVRGAAGGIYVCFAEPFWHLIADLLEQHGQPQIAAEVRLQVVQTKPT